MNSVRIQVHSITDLITNSSTTIYTHSESSPEACKKMVDEILKALGNSLTCDDMFDLSIEYDDKDELRDAVCEYADDSFEHGISLPGLQDWDSATSCCANREKVTKLLAVTPLPQWVETIAKKVRKNYEGSTWLKIEPKSPVYGAAAEAIREFLYSPDQEEGSD